MARAALEGVIHEGVYITLAAHLFTALFSALEKRAWYAWHADVLNYLSTLCDNISTKMWSFKSRTQGNTDVGKD